MRALSLVSGAAAIAAAVALAPPSAAAQALQAARTCIIRVTPIDFGTYDPNEPAPDSSIGRVLVRCPRSIILGGPEVTLSAGYSGSELDRTMLSGTGTLHYNLYTDPARQFIAGDGTQGTSPLAPAFAAIGLSLFRFFGAVQPNQHVRAGEYSDDIMVTISF